PLLTQREKLPHPGLSRNAGRTGKMRRRGAGCRIAGEGQVASKGLETVGERRRDRLRTLLRKVERDGARLQIWAATLAISTIALVVAAIFPWDDRLLYTQAALGVFLLISVVHYRLSLRSANPGRLGF